MADPHADVEEISSNRYVSIVRSSTGYGVVRRGGTIQDWFPLTDEGSDAAWDRHRELTRVGRVERALGWLVPVAIISAGLWIAILILGVTVSLSIQNEVMSGDGIVRFIEGAAAFGGALFALFAASVGCYSMLWLYRKGLPPIRQA